MTLPGGQTADEIRRRLEDRPRITLRLRITLFFLVCAICIAGITIGSVVMLSQFQTKMHFLEAADDCAFEMQEARRYEKNFFLYRHRSCPNLSPNRSGLSSAARKSRSAIPNLLAASITSSRLASAQPNRSARPSARARPPLAEPREMLTIGTPSPFKPGCERDWVIVVPTRVGISLSPVPAATPMGTPDVATRSALT